MPDLGNDESDGQGSLSIGQLDILRRLKLDQGGLHPAKGDQFSVREGSCQKRLIERRKIGRTISPPCFFIFCQTFMKPDRSLVSRKPDDHVMHTFMTVGIEQGITIDQSLE